MWVLTHISINLNVGINSPGDTWICLYASDQSCFTKYALGPTSFMRSNTFSIEVIAVGYSDISIPAFTLTGMSPKRSTKVA